METNMKLETKIWLLDKFIVPSSLITCICAVLVPIMGCLWLKNIISFSYIRYSIAAFIISGTIGCLLVTVVTAYNNHLTKNRHCEPSVPISDYERS